MRLISSSITTALLASQVLSHPASSSTYHRGLQPRVIDLSALRIEGVASYSNAMITTESGFASLVRRAGYLETATSLVQQIAPGAEFRLVDDHYIVDNGVGHVKFKQAVNGLDIDNADFNVPGPLIKRARIGPVAALEGVSSALGLLVSAEGVTAVPEADVEHYTIEGTSGAYQDPKARLMLALLRPNA